MSEVGEQAKRRERERKSEKDLLGLKRGGLLSGA
jgi:hypothetical protein